MARWSGVFSVVIGRIDRLVPDGRSTRRTRARVGRMVNVTTFELACGHDVVTAPGASGGYVEIGRGKRRCPRCTQTERRSR